MYKKKVYNNTTYPAADTFFDSFEDYVPWSLYTFLYLIVTNNKEDKYSYHNKTLAIAHSIISLMNPNKIISPLQLGLAVTLYHRFGSKDFPLLF